MPRVRSTDVSTAPSIGSLKLGQPVPLSNFPFDSNNGWPQAAHENRPGLFSKSKCAASRRLRPVSAHYVILLGRQNLAPFGVAARNDIGFTRHCRFPLMALRSTGYTASYQRRHLGFRIPRHPIEPCDARLADAGVMSAPNCGLLGFGVFTHNGLCVLVVLSARVDTLAWSEVVELRRAAEFRVQPYLITACRMLTLCLPG